MSGYRSQAATIIIGSLIIYFAVMSWPLNEARPAPEPAYAIATPQLVQTPVTITPVATAIPEATLRSIQLSVAPVATIFSIQSPNIPTQHTYSPEPETPRNNLLSYNEFMSAMATTSWRSYIINDPAFSTLLWEMAKCESGTVGNMVKTQEIGDQDIGYTSIGVFQINIEVWPQLARRYNLFLADENMQAAFEVWQSPLGLENWSCYDVVKEYFD